MVDLGFHVLIFGGLWFCARILQDNRSSCKILEDSHRLARFCKINIRRQLGFLLLHYIFAFAFIIGDILLLPYFFAFTFLILCTINNIFSEQSGNLMEPLCFI